MLNKCYFIAQRNMITPWCQNSRVKLSRGLAGIRCLVLPWLKNSFLLWSACKRLFTLWFVLTKTERLWWSRDWHTKHVERAVRHGHAVCTGYRGTGLVRTWWMDYFAGELRHTPAHFLRPPITVTDKETQTSATVVSRESHGSPPSAATTFCSSAGENSIWLHSGG